MRSTVGFAAAAVLFLVSATAPGPVLARPALLVDTPVTTIVSDYDSGVAPALQIQSDKLGAYVHSNTLTSMIFSSGMAAIPDSYYVKRATRTICLMFSQPLPGSGPQGGNPVAPPSACYLARINLECDNWGLNPLTLAAGQSMSCPMNVHFDAGGKTYDLHQAPRSVNFPGTDAVNVTCIYPTAGTNPCSQWLVQPSVVYVAPDATTQLRNVANLSYETTVKGKTAYVKQGDFYFSFSILMTKP